MTINSAFGSDLFDIFKLGQSETLDFFFKNIQSFLKMGYIVKSKYFGLSHLNSVFIETFKYKFCSKIKP